MPTREEWDVERAEAAVIVNAYDTARSLGVGYATPTKVIKAMIDNPFMFAISVPRVRDEAKIRTHLAEWEALARDLGLSPGSLASGDEAGDTEAERALRLVRRLIMSGRPIVIIYEDHPRTLLHGAPRPGRLFGAVLEDLGNGRRGYRVPWTSLLRRMLNAQPGESSGGEGLGRWLGEGRDRA